MPTNIEPELDDYDPLKDPDARAWLAASEDERAELVRAYHHGQNIEIEGGEAHVMIHLVIENQLAEDSPLARETLTRLLAEGLDRHQAIHAMGTVLMEHLLDLMNKPQPDGDANVPYYAALRRLTAESWRRSG